MERKQSGDAGTSDNYAGVGCVEVDGSGGGERRLTDSVRDRQRLADLHAHREQQQPAAIS